MRNRVKRMSKEGGIVRKGEEELSYCSLTD